MKLRNISKWISYFLLPIFLLIFIFSIFFMFMNETKDDDSKISSDVFISTYMDEISEFANALIFYNQSFSNIKDEENTICYYQGEFVYSVIDDIKFLIIYKDKALTNIELTSDTDTLEKIKALINDSEQKHTFIINGNVESDTDILDKKAIQYFDRFNYKYYKTEETDDIYDVNYYEEGYNRNKVNYYNTNIKDFEIYTSYNENIIKRYDNEKILFDGFEILSPYSNLIYGMVPISAVLFLLTLIFLTSKIGKTHNSDEVIINRLDTIWFEIVLALSMFACGICFIPMALGLDFLDIVKNKFEILIILFISTYFIIYIILAIVYTTFIKRIKTRTFLKTTFFGKILIFMKKILKKSIMKIKDSISSFNLTSSNRKKIIIYIIGFIIIEILLLLIFNFLGFLLDVVLFIYVLNKIMKIISSYEKIENKLKNMYDGNNQVELNIDELDDGLKNIAKYINDISAGFDNAIQNSIKSERLKTELITNVSHDIKTPLTSIINYVDLLKKEDVENDKIKEYIDILENKSQRLKKLIDDLIEASKASTGSIKLNLEKINIVELLNQSIGEFKDKFEVKELDIVTKFDKSETFINADSRYFYRIVENLFSNIAKYSLEKSRVYINLKDDDNLVKISIKNISKESLNISSEELMQRFVRGDMSRTTEGSGLGISIAKSLTELQGGIFELSIDGDLFKVEISFNK